MDCLQLLRCNFCGGRIVFGPKLTKPARDHAGGVIPHIHKSLISKGAKAKKSKKNSSA